MPYRVPFLIQWLLLWCTTISSTNGFFFKSRKTVCQAPLSPLITTTVLNDYNTSSLLHTRWSIRGEFRALRMKQKETNIGTDNKNKTIEINHRPSLAVVLRDKIRRVIVAVGRVLYAVKASAAIIAIQTVLRIKMEGYVLRRLPLNVLMFLLEVSVTHPEVLQSIAQEVGERLSKEVSLFTGKDTYHIGDIAKAIVARYTGMEQYQFGNLTRATMSRMPGWDPKTHDNKDGSVTLSNLVRCLGTEKLYSISSKEMETILYRFTRKRKYDFGDMTKALLNRMKAE